jgi:hypothetical protein
MDDLTKQSEPKDKRLVVLLTDSDKTLLNAIARRERTSVGALVRRFIIERIDPASSTPSSS